MRVRVCVCVRARVCLRRVQNLRTGRGRGPACLARCRRPLLCHLPADLHVQQAQGDYAC
jgi:hypothetical protein